VTLGRIDDYLSQVILGLYTKDETEETYLNGKQ
jgi:hypothetical protein